MTTKQAIRTVLKDTKKFVIGDYNGQKWYCPDGYIATTDDIYSQYKPKKSQLDNFKQFEHVNNQPKLEGIFDRINQGDYVPVTNTTNIINTCYTELSGGIDGVEEKVNTTYLKFMQVLYPEAHFEIDSTYKYSPVKVVENNQTVALIMPVRD